MSAVAINSLIKPNVQPFLKWAGGKRWLINGYPHLFPRMYNRYIEPFLGSGAVYFYLKPENAILSDLNKELIETYLAIKNHWKKVVKKLEVHQLCHGKRYYYQVRKQKFADPIERAAKFIYLNRTCWNGLYRVNLNGQFNVPIGTKTNVLLTDDDFKKVSARLNKSEMICSDFEPIIDKAGKNDFLFVDPPYTVTSNQSNFIKYNELLFSWEDQIRLRNALVRAKDRGVLIFLTNAYHETVESLYRDHFNLLMVTRSSVIAGDSSKRKPYEEYIVRSY